MPHIDLHSVQTRYSAKSENGPWTLMDSTEHVGSIEVQMGKSSVDTGGFTPGIYRVNPYSIWREEMEIDESEPLTAIYQYRWYPEWYKFTLTGNYLLDACRTFSTINVPPNLSTCADVALQKRAAT